MNDYYLTRNIGRNDEIQTLSDLQRIRDLRTFSRSCQKRLDQLRKIPSANRDEIDREESFLHAAQQEIHRLEYSIAQRGFG